MIAGLVDGSVPDYQISAWAMAVMCRGMDAQETAALTDCMLDSGGRLERASERPRVDKHSTGGLGDKVSLVLAPLLACCDLDVPMFSGRGLGITGGTLDKLEAYSGYRCDLDKAAIDEQLRSIGCVITGTTPDIAPADRKLYALRDVTGTVPSIPLITASIMSKKLAGSLDALVLDVKCGSGAFMTTVAEAQELAVSLKSTGERMGLATSAILTDMNQPLGRMVGNACEANEAVEVLQGAGPEDVRSLTLRLCAGLLVATGKAESINTATRRLAALLDDGSALRRYQQMIEAQGGEFREQLVLSKPWVVTAEQAAAGAFFTAEEMWVKSVDGKSVGRAVIELGGGRRRQGDRLNYRTGIEMLVRVGDRVSREQPIVRIFGEEKSSVDAAKYLLQAAFEFSAQPVERLALFVG